MLKKYLILIYVFFLFLKMEANAEQSWYQLPQLLPPAEYGDVVINRVSNASEMKPAYFSHWTHRLKYTCRVCHLELEFEMKANTTDMTKKKMMAGQYCGACHDGNTAFGLTECKSCHNKNEEYMQDKFKMLSVLPKTKYGNNIDWVGSFRKKLINPKQSIKSEGYSPMPFRKNLSLAAEMVNIPPAIFPHKAHTDWLDCDNCHPDVFNIKKKTTAHFSMDYILDGKFCGLCHLRIAFPLDDCKRCHPGIK